MPMNAICYKNLTIANDELMHFGVIGMHWGIRRFQPYGQGYDPDHEGKEIGLAARLAGRTGSYSDAIKKGSSFQNKAKNAISAFGKKAGRGLNEGLERLNYANDRMGVGLKSLGKKAKSGLADYASTYLTKSGHKILVPEDKSLYEHAGFGSLGKAVAERFVASTKTNAKRAEAFGKEFMTKYKDPELRSNFNKNVINAMATTFSSRVQNTKTKSSEFLRNAKMTSAFLVGALDPTSSASQILGGRYNSNGAAKTSNAKLKNPFAGLNHPEFRDIGERVDARGFRTNLGNTTPKKMKDMRENAYYFDASVPFDVSKNKLDQARSTLLSDMAVKNPYRMAVNASDLDSAKSTVNDILSSMQSRSNLGTMRRAMTRDPYEYEMGKRLLGL